MRLSRIAFVTLSLGLLAVSSSLAQSGNLLTNGGFASDLAGWGWDARYQQAPGSESWSPLDANGSSTSGSAVLRVTAAGRARQLLQCVNLIPGQIYQLGTKVYFPPSQSIIGEALIAYVEYSSPDCMGRFTGFGELKFIDSRHRGVWIPLVAKPPTAPTSASIQVIIGSALRTAGDFSAHFDDVYLTLVPPTVVVASLPNALIQRAATGGATTTYTLSNVGETPTSITIDQVGTFFTQTPASFVLEPRGSQVVTVTALAQAPGEFNGSATPRGAGVAAGLVVPIRLASLAFAADGQATAERRLDFSAPAEIPTISAAVTYANPGDDPIEGVLSSDVRWIRTPSQLVTIPPRGSLRVPFTIDRTLRSEDDGSITGALRLEYLRGSGAKRVTPYADDPVGATSTTVKDSIAIPVNLAAAKPPENSVTLFLPGVGHVTGSVGTFISDVVVSASKTIGLSPYLDIFYTTASAGEAFRISRKLVPNQLLSLADVVRSYFGREGETGSIQIRTDDPRQITVGANVFNNTNLAGTYGTAIPVFRSDRSTLPGESLYLTGVLGSSVAAHTNLIIQETGGGSGTVTIEFLTASGAVAGSTSASLTPYSVARMSDVAPAGAVSAVLRNAAGTARFAAYGTPVDKALERDGTRKGGDTWVIADWTKVMNYPRNAKMIVPVAGVTRGANDTLYRTDLSILQCGPGAGTGRVTFYPRGGQPIFRDLRLDERASAVYPNVVESLFGVTSGVGYITFVPTSGNWSLAARIFATTGGQVATFGTAVPVLALDSGLRKGDSRRIAGFDDSGAATISAATPGTFRSNIGLVETRGFSVKVRLTLHNVVPEGATALSAATIFKEYTLAAGESMSLNGIAQEILGARRSLFRKDLKDLFVDVSVVDGTGAVIPYVSTVDNGTADQILFIP